MIVFPVIVSTQAQELVYKIYSDQQVYPGAVPVSIAEDSTGFTLILTSKGLVRFNGVEFKPIRHAPRFTQLSQITQPRKGSKMAIGLAEDGIYRINSRTDTVLFQRVLRCPHPIAFFEDPQGDWWIHLQSGKMLHSHANQLDSYAFPEGKVTEPVYFWSNQQNQIYFFNRNGQVFYRIKDHPILARKDYVPKLNSITSIASHSNNSFWLADSSKLYLIEVDTKPEADFHIQAIQSLASPITSLVEEAQTFLYASTIANGIQRIPLKQKPYQMQPVLFGNQRTVLETFPWPSVETVYRCRSSFWLVSQGKLVSVYAKPFYYPFPELLTYETGSMAQSARGNFYFGSVNQVFKVIGETPSDTLKSLVRIPEGSISTIAAEGNRIWIGNSDGQLSYLENDQWKPGLALQKRGGAIFNIFSDSKKRVWFCQVYRKAPLPGISYTDSTLQVRYFGAAQGLPGRIISIAQSPKGNIVVGGIGDHSYLYSYDESTGTFKNLSVALPFDVSYFEIHDLSVDQQDNIWLASTHGLLQYSPRQKKLIRIDLGPYITTTEIRAVKVDAHGQVWISTDSFGLFCYQNGEIVRFVSGDGLPTTSNTLWYRRLLIDDQSRVWVGSSTTYSATFMPNFRPSRTPTPILLSSATDSDTLSPHRSGFTLDHRSDLKLTYTCLSFPPGTIEYRLKLLTPTDSQVVLTYNPHATFSSLFEGNYTLQLQARQSGYAWSQPTQFQFSVQPVWYRQWWAYVCYVLVAGGLVWGLIQLKTWRQERENKRLNVLVDVKTQELRDAHQEVIAQNEELLSQQEEISLQRNQITVQYEQLQNAQQTIEQQNQTIRKRNRNLEKQVAERTKELVEYNQQLEQFAFITAHNLRAPVARIQGLGQLLDMAKTQPTIDSHDVAQKLIRTAYDLDQVIKDLNTILEIKKNSTQVLIPINLYDEIEKVISNLRKEIEDTHTLIQIQISQVYAFLSLPAYIDSILYNLISNAIKYRQTDRKPEIVIKTILQEQTFSLEISDNGLGIDLEMYGKNIYHLYKRFHFHVEGKGLGLYLVKTQVAALGGRIELDSKVNQGTTFRIYFPIDKTLMLEQPG